MKTQIKNIFSKFSFRNFLIILLVLLGLTRITGFSFGLSSTTYSSKIIKGLAASPIPDVFVGVRGSINSPSIYTIEIETVSGKIISFDRSYEFTSMMKGPLNRREVYIHAMNPKHPTTIRTKAIAYGLCNPGSLKKGLNITEDVKTSKLLRRGEVTEEINCLEL